MGNQSNVPQARRYQENPIICCGDEPRREPLDEASPNVMNVEKRTYGRFSKAHTGSQKNQQHLNMEQTGQTYYNNKDVTIFRRPGNQLQNSTFQNPRINNLQNDNISKDSKDANPLKPITQQQTQMKKSGFASFKKSTYGAYNNSNTFSSYGANAAKQSKQNFKQNLDSKNHKPTPMVDFVGQKEVRQEIKKEQVKRQGPFVGQGKYGGRIDQFENNKRIVMFLDQNHVKDPKFKFYETKDNSSLLNNSTIMVAKKKSGKIEEKYLDQNSTSNLKVNQNLSQLQKPIELNFQIDARMVLATCLLIIAIIILVLGATVFPSDTDFFICLMIAIILYVCYILICYIYNDLLEYFSNARSFEQFEEDFKKLRETNGELSYHLQLQTPKTVIKECYLMSKQNKYTKILEAENQNGDLSISDMKDKQTSCIFIKYKTKTSFFDPESQLNTINYFDDFLEEQKDIVQAHFGDKSDTKKSSMRAQKEKTSKATEKKQTNFKKALKRSDFGYQLDQIDGLSHKPEQNFTVCYTEDGESACLTTMFVIFTLFGLCLPFLCFFEAYTKRYRINLLNRLRIGEGAPLRA